MSIRPSIITPFAVLFLACSAAHAEQYTVPLFPAPDTSGDPQGVLRIVNDTGDAATVQIFAIADDGTRAGPATVALGASAAAEFDATELRSANAAKGLSGGLGSISGDVRLTIDSDAPIVPLAFVRASDGTLSAMHDTVRAGSATEGEYRYDVPIFNLSTAVAQASRLRLINAGETTATVEIEGRDDGATATGGTVRFTLPAGGARTLTAQQLEAGGTGLTGRLGAGIGRWRLTVSSDQALRVVNVVESSTGHWNNLSTTAVRGAAPADRVGFNDRFVGETAVLETDAGRSSLRIMENGRFSDTQSADGMAATLEGDYDYVGLGPDAGRLTLDYDDGTRCEANVYFSSRTSGWFASQCTGGPDPDTWSGGNWFVADEEDDGGGADPVETSYGVGATLPGVPMSGLFVPARLDPGSGSVRSSGGSTTVDLNDGGYFELSDGTRYTCASAGGCEIVDGTVTRGSVTGRTAGSGGGEIDRFPVFPAAGRPGDQSYAVGTAINTLTLPEATGGNPPLTYSLSPDVPVRLRAAGSYAMSYTVTDVDGDLHTLHFNIEVGAGDTDDHGDTFDTATTVSIPSTTPGELEAGKEEGDRDYFRVVVAATTTLTVETTGSTDTFGTLFDGSRARLTTNDDGGTGRNFRIERQLQAGTYYVEVRGYRPSRTGSYELRVSGADDTGGGGDDGQTTFGVGDTLSGLPTGTWVPNISGGGAFLISGDGVTLRLNDASYFEHEGHRYTCQSAAGCVIENRRVTSGTVVRTAAGTAPGNGDTDGSMAGQFQLHDDNDAPRGIAFANGRLYVVDRWDEKVYAYTASGDRDPMADFDLASSSDGGSGIDFANGRFYVAYRADTKVYAYTASGDREPTADFDLHGDNANPRGIAHYNGQFYVTDGVDRKVYAYAASGARNPAADFDLHADNGQPGGIAYAMGRFHVVDWRDDKVYAYTESGARDPGGDFNLREDLGGNEGYGITYGNDGFYVVDSDSVVSGLGNTDTVHFYPAPTGGNGTGQGARPSFAAGSGPGDQTYTVGTAISTLSLPTASGGDGSLTYSLSPEVPGLSFNATTRRLSGTPSRAGTYNMTYRARDVDGDTDTLTFVITVNDGGDAGVSLPGHPSVTHRVSPSQLIVGERAQLILDWIEVPGATSYEVRVSTVPILYTRHSDRSCTVSRSVTTRETSYTHEFTASFINNYYWFVQACNSAGCSCPP